MLKTPRRVIFLFLITFSTLIFNYNVVIGLQSTVGINQSYNEDTFLSSNSTNDTVLCSFPGPENNMYITIVNNASVPVSGAKVSGFVDYACGSQATRPIDTVITPSNGTVGLYCSFCNTFGPYNITITKNSQNSSFYIQTTMKYLGQTSWALVSLTNHSYSLKEFDGSKCYTFFSVSFSDNKADFYCSNLTAQNSDLNTANYYWLSILIIPLYAVVQNRKKK